MTQTLLVPLVLTLGACGAPQCRDRIWLKQECEIGAGATQS